MFNVKDFLDCALYNHRVVFVTNGCEIEDSTVVEIGNKYDGRTFSTWDIWHGTIRLFLD